MADDNEPQEEDRTGRRDGDGNGDVGREDHYDQDPFEQFEDVGDREGDPFEQLSTEADDNDIPTGSDPSPGSESGDQRAPADPRPEDDPTVDGEETSDPDDATKWFENLPDTGQSTADSDETEAATDQRGTGVDPSDLFASESEVTDATTDAEAGRSSGGATMDAEAGPSSTGSGTGREPGDDPFPDMESAFEQMDIDGLDPDAVWEQLSDVQAQGSVSEVGKRTYAEVSKHSYCEQCEHFSEPPAITCSHEGTEILEFLDMDTVRVVDCPVVAERQELEEQE